MGSEIGLYVGKTDKTGLYVGRPDKINEWG